MYHPPDALFRVMDRETYDKPVDCTLAKIRVECLLVCSGRTQPICGKYLIRVSFSLDFDNLLGPDPEEPLKDTVLNNLTKV